jgi:hypothetical protein
MTAHTFVHYILPTSILILQEAIVLSDGIKWVDGMKRVTPESQRKRVRVRFRREKGSPTGWCNSYCRRFNSAGTHLYVPFLTIGDENRRDKKVRETKRTEANIRKDETREETKNETTRRRGERERGLSLSAFPERVCFLIPFSVCRMCV